MDHFLLRCGFPSWQTIKAVHTVNDYVNWHPLFLLVQFILENSADFPSLSSSSPSFEFVDKFYPWGKSVSCLRCFVCLKNCHFNGYSGCPLAAQCTQTSPYTADRCKFTKTWFLSPIPAISAGHDITVIADGIRITSIPLLLMTLKMSVFCPMVHSLSPATSIWSSPQQSASFYKLLLQNVKWQFNIYLYINPYVKRGVTTPLPPALS